MKHIVQIGAMEVLIEQKGPTYKIHDAGKYHWLGGYRMGCDGFGQWKFYTGSPIPKDLLEIESTLHEVIMSLRNYNKDLWLGS